MQNVLLARVFLQDGVGNPILNSLSLSEFGNRSSPRRAPGKNKIGNEYTIYCLRFILLDNSYD